MQRRAFWHALRKDFRSHSPPPTNLLLHCALSCAVYCSRPCLFVCLWVRLTTASAHCLRRLWALVRIVQTLFPYIWFYVHSLPPPKRLCFHRCVFVCLYVHLFVSLAGLREKNSTDFHKIPWEGGILANEETIAIYL